MNTREYVQDDVINEVRFGLVKLEEALSLAPPTDNDRLYFLRRSRRQVQIDLGTAEGDRRQFLLQLYAQISAAIEAISGGGTAK
ncbi:MAG TPA: hypothetical protein VNT99_03675 [Methylomirabilota bacterium]|nr:hypothetical protein [Methylomirabilota bacterium]